MLPGSVSNLYINVATSTANGPQQPPLLIYGDASGVCAALGAALCAPCGRRYGWVDPLKSSPKLPVI